MSRQKRPDLYALEPPDKPLTEMTTQEKLQYAAKLRRALRDDEIRVGTRFPRTARERQIFDEGQAERDQRQAKRIARAQRKRARRAAQGGTPGEP